MSLEELSISIVNVKQEIDEDDKLDIMRTVLNKHDYIIVKKESDTDNNNEMDEEEDEEGDLSEEEELVDFEDDEAEADKIQAAQTLAELSMMQPSAGMRKFSVQVEYMRFIRRRMSMRLWRVLNSRSFELSTSVPRSRGSRPGNTMRPGSPLS